ncbi:hypothetical protein R2083_13895 [Nitrosomonas sp. Is35]|uniref:hypothetical protein n=1 Tax=Nitrosomonas sp. Is35 TaxID=3080534 RepID=UPI00294B91C0|nr:hypothetical protein [Nitrosomonas sp. Is35]MDV6348610.1 hypothetical protein [Nitrosomonas sp. Is35]
MKFVVRIIFNVILLGIVSGCVSMQQMQSGMDEINSFWGEANQKIISSKGTRIYPNKAIDCWIAAKESAIQLGFTVIEESNNSILTAQALTPIPFTVDEYKAIKAIEEPMMQAIAANHVGKFYSNFYYLDEGGKFYVTIKVQITPEADDKSSVRVTFRIDPTEEIKGYSFIYGHNPPPESVRKGLEKWWHTFERNLIQK